MKLARQESRDIAIAVLTQQVDAGAGLNADGREAYFWWLIFCTGLQVTTDSGSTWIAYAGESHGINKPGTANYKIAREAVADGRAFFTAVNIEPLALAAEYDPIARDACKFLVTRIKAQGKAIPDMLGDALSKSGKQRRGPNKAVRRVRDANIIHAVWHLRESGLNLYQNETKNVGDSAIGVVSDALIYLGHPLSYDAVRKIWERHSG